MYEVISGQARCWRQGWPLALLLLGALALGPEVEAQTGTATTKAGAPVALHRSEADLFAATLAGRYAQAVDDPQLAAEAWTQAFIRRPNDKDLYERATQANLVIGNYAMVVRLAKLVPANQHAERAKLGLAIEAFAAGRFGDVIRLTQTIKDEPDLVQFATHLRAYSFLGQGQAQAAIDLVTKPTGEPDIDDAALMSRACILLHAQRPKEAMDLLGQAWSKGQTSPTGLRLYALLLATNGRRSEAVGLMRSVAVGNSVEAAAFVSTLEAVQQDGFTMPRRSLQTNTTEGLLTLVEARMRQRPSSDTADLLFLLNFLTPGSNAVNAALGKHLISYGQDDLAGTALSRVSSASPDYVGAQVELAWLTYARDPAAALMAACALAATRKDAAAQNLLADMLAANRRDEEADAAYDELIKRAEVEKWPASQIWPLYFGRGGARERLGRWSEALADLRFAKNAAPNQANVLNYLGYAMADRGENLDEALTLLRNAMRLRPRSGAIADSYGWALFKLGRYEESVAILERAAMLSPNLAEVADHLGDAYWRTGRHQEARLEWQRVLTLNPTASMAAEVGEKLEVGLPPDPFKAADAAILALTRKN